MPDRSMQVEIFAASTTDNAQVEHTAIHRWQT
jgi:hypothetical protein